MKKIMVNHRVDSRLLADGMILSKIKQSMLCDFAKEMENNNALIFAKTSGVPGNLPSTQDDIEFHLMGYVITNDEYKEILDILKELNSSVSSDILKHYLKRINKIITNENT